MTEIEHLILPNHPADRARLMQENAAIGFGPQPGMMAHEEGALAKRETGHSSRQPLRRVPSRWHKPYRAQVTKANVRPMWAALALVAFLAALVGVVVVHG